MGVAETHQVLTRNELRERVVLRADGGFRSGRDVLMSAALGADEYGFGTVAMIATGCIMARVCHTNNCPVGVASQREELRARFPGAPADLVNFFHFVAEEVGPADWGDACVLLLLLLLVLGMLASGLCSNTRDMCLWAAPETPCNPCSRCLLSAACRCCCCCFPALFPAQVRAGLAQLGLRSLDELVGRADYLKQRDTPLAKTSECAGVTLLGTPPLESHTRMTTHSGKSSFCRTVYRHCLARRF